MTTLTWNRRNQMTTLRTAAQQALEALQEYQSNGAPFLACDGAVAALKAALTQQDKPVEPVAWSGYNLDGMVEAFSRVIEAHHSSKHPFHNPIDMDARMALRILRGFIPAMKAYAAPPQQAEPVEPVAWRTFDGEGGYDYRTYADNENYAAEWAQRNPRHVGWVKPLYTAPPRCPNCASLEAQNTELDRRLAELERAESAQEPVQEPVQEHEDWCASVTQLLLSYPPQKAPCNCKPRHAEPVQGPVQEPVAWMCSNPELMAKGYERFSSRCEGDWNIPVYLSPPQRKPQAFDEAMRLPRAMAQAYENGYNAGVAHEREACERACKHQPHWVACVAAIRARGDA